MPVGRSPLPDQSQRSKVASGRDSDLNVPMSAGLCRIVLGVFLMACLGPASADDAATTHYAGRPVIDVLQTTTFGTIAAASSLVVGVIILLLAWLQLGSDISRSGTTEVRRLWFTLGAWSLPLLLTPPLIIEGAVATYRQSDLRPEMLAFGFGLTVLGALLAQMPRVFRQTAV